MDKAWKTVFFNAIGIVESSIVAMKAIWTAFSWWVGGLWDKMIGHISSPAIKLALKTDFNEAVQKQQKLLEAANAVTTGDFKGDHYDKNDPKFQKKIHHFL